MEGLEQALLELQQLTERLRRDCPWDREQTARTIVPHTVEEAYEVADAALAGDDDKLLDELGDLLFQVYFLALLLEEQGKGDLAQAARLIHEKLVRRHPHVFADVEVKGAGDVLKNWERIKAAEKKDRGLLESVPRSLPALVRAQRVGEKVERVGFDWPDARGSRAKVAEELGELDRAIAEGDKARIEGELGDVLFALVNLARHVDVDAEGALRGTIAKFQRRFEHVEARVKERHGGWPAASNEGAGKLALDELDGYWDEAKEKE